MCYFYSKIYLCGHERPGKMYKCWQYDPIKGECSKPEGTVKVPQNLNQSCGPCRERDGKQDRRHHRINVNPGYYGYPKK
jgi:hypothetical protein